MKQSEDKVLRRICTTCGRTKAPRGRSISDATYNSYCTREQCKGYDEEPRPGDLWPGETAEEFGFPCKP
jgi:hypothetical protein